MGYSMVRKKGLGLGCVICTAETCTELVSSKQCGNRGLAKAEKGGPGRVVSVCVRISSEVVMGSGDRKHGSLGQ